MDELTKVLAAERRKIAQALHDGLCQDLQGLRLLTEIHFINLAPADLSFRIEAEKIRDFTKKATDEIHKILKLLRA